VNSGPYAGSKPPPQTQKSPYGRPPEANFLSAAHAEIAQQTPYASKEISPYTVVLREMPCSGTASDI